MKRLSPNGLESMLHDIHTKLVAFPNAFREKVNEECAWSTPTYYRKMRNGELNSVLSNAEREKIIAVLDEKLKELNEYFEKYKRQ